MSSDNSAYGPHAEPVDLGKVFNTPVTTGQQDIADSSSQSPLAQSRGTADPIDINPAPVRMGMK